MHMVRGYLPALEKYCWPCNATQLHFMGVFYILPAPFQKL